MYAALGGWGGGVGGGGGGGGGGVGEVGGGGGGVLIATHSILLDAITYPFMRYLLLAPNSSICYSKIGLAYDY